MLKAVCCVFLVVVISGVFSSVVVNNSLRLVRLEAAVCSTLSASLRGVLSSESSETDTANQAGKENIIFKSLHLGYILLQVCIT